VAVPDRIAITLPEVAVADRRVVRAAAEDPVVLRVDLKGVLDPGRVAVLAGDEVIPDDRTGAGGAPVKEVAVLPA
jgi:hypothetical protein